MNDSDLLKYASSPVRLGALLFGLALLLRVADHAYHSDSKRILRVLRLEGEPAPGEQYYKSLDSIFAPLPFVWSWCDILAATICAAYYDRALLWLVLVFVVGSRFRALQEAGHTATHRGLCRPRKRQWALANVFFQYPAFKPDVHHRYIAHVLQHHRHANEPENDPNIVRFIAMGVVPGISNACFYRKLFHPFTPLGMRETLHTMALNARRNRAPGNALVRMLVVSLVAGGFYLIAGAKGLLFGYVVPLVTIYPWYSWISALAEHRWFVECTGSNRFDRECTNGRPTDYSGLLGWLVKHSIFPATDHYHLAHSLYPHLRWNYLAAIDRVLRAKDPRYGRHLSHGLLWTDRQRHSALSELRERLTTSDRSDLAGWARGLQSSERAETRRAATVTD